MRHAIIDKCRLWLWLVLACVTTAVVATIAPHQVGVLVWSLSKLCFGAYLGYWIDRSVFYYARPGSVSVGMVNTREMAIVLAASMIRRALIMVAAIIALGLGV